MIKSNLSKAMVLTNNLSQENINKITTKVREFINKKN